MAVSQVYPCQHTGQATSPWVLVPPCRQLGLTLGICFIWDEAQEGMHGL